MSSVDSILSYLLNSVQYFSYYIKCFPYVVPYLLPATNTLMTCSVYATVAVAINRFVEMSPRVSFPFWLESGKVQSVIVFVFSIIFNLSRWCEFEFHYVDNVVNVTRDDGTVETVNTTVVQLKVSKSTIVNLKLSGRIQAKA